MTCSEARIRHPAPISSGLFTFPKEPDKSSVVKAEIMRRRGRQSSNRDALLSTSEKESAWLSKHLLQQCEAMAPG